MTSIMPRANLAFMYPHGDGQLQREAELNRYAGEIQHEGGPKQDPGRPGRERGDRSELLAVLVGVSAGGVAGAVVAILSASVDIFVGVIVGVVAGGLMGAVVGDSLKKRAGGKAS